MRVIAGSAGGLTLHPPGKETRPTMDRVRGAIFSSLGDRVPDARVLDLFAEVEPSASRRSAVALHRLLSWSNTAQQQDSFERISTLPALKGRE